MSDVVVVGPAAVGTAVAGKATLFSLILDSNGDGILDIKQPAVIAGVIEGILRTVGAALPAASIPVSIAIQVIDRTVALLPAEIK